MENVVATLWRDSESVTYLKFSVHSVETADKMLQEELECLRQTKQVLALAVRRKEGGNAGATVVDEATLICSHVLWLGVRRVTTGGRVAVRLRRRIERRVSGESVVTRFL